MDKRIFISVIILALCTLIGLSNCLVIAGDYQLWHDTIQSSPTWNQWPTTLAVILVEFTDVKHDSFLDPSTGTMTPFDTVYTWQDFYNMLASDNYYITLDPFDPLSQPRSPDNEPVFGSLRDYFYNMSNGAYRPIIEILNDMIAPNQPPEWYMMPHTKQYYISLDPYNRGNSFGPLTNDAIALASADSKNVTRNANRRICVIYAGNKRDGLSAWAYQGSDRYMAFERWKHTQQFG